VILRLRQGKSMRAGALSLLIAVVFFAGPGCDSFRSAGSVEVWVFNQGLAAFMVAGQTTEYWSSTPFQMGRNDTLRLPITRDERVLDTLVLTTLVPATDEGRYGAVVNVHEDTLDHLHIEEFSPYLDACLTGVVP
jgi:hypothetical protein